MLSHVSRATRTGSAVVALARSARGAWQTRAFLAPTVSRRADFVQELYLKELKAYKTPPVKESDAAGHVQTFTMPKTPSTPEESDLASSLKEYKSMAVEVEGQEVSSSSDAASNTAALPDWLEAEEEPSQGH